MTTGVHVFTLGIFTHLDALFDRQYIADAILIILICLQNGGIIGIWVLIEIGLNEIAMILACKIQFCNKQTEKQTVIILG